jgi:hypothetical protein
MELYYKICCFKTLKKVKDVVIKKNLWKEKIILNNFNKELNK